MVAMVARDVTGLANVKFGTLRALVMACARTHGLANVTIDTDDHFWSSRDYCWHGSRRRRRGIRQEGVVPMISSRATGSTQVKVDTGGALVVTGTGALRLTHITNDCDLFRRSR